MKLMGMKLTLKNTIILILAALGLVYVVQMVMKKNNLKFMQEKKVVEKLHCGKTEHENKSM